MAFEWPADLPDWDRMISALPGVHVLQTRSWAKVKAAYGWQPLPQVWQGTDGVTRAAALVLERTVSPLKLRVLYVPRGPLLDWQDESWRRRVLGDLQALARHRGAIFIKIDPEVLVGHRVHAAAEFSDRASGEGVIAYLKQNGWRFSGEQVQFRNTVWLDLRLSEDELLAAMKQKTRYNIRLAEKKGVRVRPGREDELPQLYRMYAETAARDGFAIRPQEYYLAVWKEFIHNGMADPLVAEVEGEIVAALVLFHFAGKAWYLYGMSRDAHREKMPNHLLQWAAIQRARQLGCHTYDLWGAPDHFDPADSMWGVYKFKEGLGGEVIGTLGAWDYPARPLLYALYTRYLPRILDWMRRRGRERTRREVSL